MTTVTLAVLGGVPLHRDVILHVPGGPPFSVGTFFYNHRRSRGIAAASSEELGGASACITWRRQALDHVYGALWRHPLLSAEVCREAGALEPQLQPHVLRWTAGLGAWALNPGDAAFMINLSVVLKLRREGRLTPDLVPPPKRLSQGRPAGTPAAPARPSTDAGRVYDPTQAWLRRQRVRLNTYGIGGGGQQLRPRHLALLDECVPGWDSRWQRMLEACRRYLRRRGKLPRDGPKQVAAACHLAPDPSADVSAPGAYTGAAEGAAGGRGDVAAADAAGGAGKADGTESAGRVEALAGWLTKQQQQLSDITLSVERIAALDRALGPQWRSYKPAQKPRPPESEPPVRVLHRLCEAARSCGLPPDVLTPVIDEFFLLATACRRSVRRKSLRYVQPQPDGGGSGSGKWQRALLALPEGPRERRLRTAICHVSAAPAQDTPALPKTWQFVLHVAELADFWHLHQRHPSRAACAPIKEQQLSKTVSRWLSLANSGQMPADRQMLLDAVIHDLRQHEIPAAWRDSKRSHGQWERWRSHVEELRAHLAAQGRLPSSGDAARWLQRMRWRKRSHKLQHLLWLDAELEGWDTLELNVRRRGGSAAADGAHAAVTEDR